VTLLNVFTGPVIGVVNRFTVADMRDYKVGAALEAAGATWVPLPLEQLHLVLDETGRLDVVRRDPVGQDQRLAELELTGIVWRVSENLWPTVGPLVAALDAGSAPLVNSSACLGLCASKWATHTTLTRAGIPSIPTRVLMPGADAPDLGTAITVVKPNVGASGREVRGLKPGERTGRSETTVAQPLIPSRVGDDLSVLVCSGRAVAAMHRVGGSPRTTLNVVVNNVEAGGAASAAELTPEAADLAVAVAQAVGADIVRVDMLPWKGQLHVLDVNGSPGLASIDDVAPVDCMALAARTILDASY